MTEARPRVLILYREADEREPYAAALKAAGIEPHFALPEEDPVLDGHAGLLLMGDCDVDPALYGEPRQPETEAADRALDMAEHTLLGQALARDMPVLAICRGLQLLNVFHGGTLIQHLDPPERHRRKDEDKSLPAHTVIVEPGTVLHQIAGRNELRVNSRHHQAIKDLGQRLRISATDPRDGTVEGLERTDRRFVVGVQWHPENQALHDPDQLRIFQSFRTAMLA